MVRISFIIGISHMLKPQTHYLFRLDEVLPIGLFHSEDRLVSKQVHSLGALYYMIQITLRKGKQNVLS